MATYDDILTGGGLPMGGVGRRPLIDFRTYANPDVESGGGGTVRTPASGNTPAPTTPTTPTTPSTPSTPATSTETPKKKLSYMEMFQQMNPYTPPTPEEVEKEKRKQKQKQIFAAIGDGISAMANIYFTTQYAPNMWDAENSMSKKTRERWEKAQKEKEANQRAYMEGYLRAAAMDDANERDDRNWRHTLEREGIDDKRYEENIAHRDKREGIEDQRYDAEIQHRGEREKVQDDQWQKTFDQNAYQFKVTTALKQQEIAIQRESVRNQMANDNPIFVLGNGKGTITIPKTALNGANISYIFSKLPKSVRDTIVGPAYKVKGRGGKEEVRYGPPDSEAMLSAIGTYVGDYPEVQSAIREVSGKVQTSNKGRGY